MIQCYFGAKGGVGTSIIAQSIAYLKAKDKKTLLIDGTFRERSQDILNNIDEPSAFDFFDVLYNDISPEDAITKLGERKPDIMLTSTIHLIGDISQNTFVNNLNILEEMYEEIIVDLSRWWIDDILYWASVGSEFKFVSNTDPISLRGLDRLLYFCLKEKVNPKKEVIFNMIKSKEDLENIAKWNLTYELPVTGYILYQNFNEKDLPKLKETMIVTEPNLVNIKSEKRSLINFLLGGRND